MDSDRRSDYFTVRSENGGIRDLYRFLVLADIASGNKFIETSNEDCVMGRDTWDHRWVIFISIIVRKIIAFFGKPMEWTGYCFEFFLNLISDNGNILRLLLNLLQGKAVIPKRGSETFISVIGHLDGRIDLLLLHKKTTSSTAIEEEEDDDTSASLWRRVLQQPLNNNTSLMDLCIMTSKLAYENAKVVRNVVNQHWKMHFVDFYNCWNDYQKEKSTKVFIMSDKAEDASLIVIGFRGTEPFNVDNWSTDFDYSWYEIPKLGKVHMGFIEALGLGNRADISTFDQAVLLKDNNNNNVLKEEEKESPSSGSNSSSSSSPEMVERSAYYAVRSKLKSMLKQHEKAKFVVTGHSLGGALAILFPTVLVLHKEKEVMERLAGVYTFGQPRVGNRELGRLMEEEDMIGRSRYLRVVYCNDIVPRLPLDNKTFLYKHFGVCLYYDSLFVEKNMDQDDEPNPNYFGFQFLIPEYFNAVWELIRSITMGCRYGPDYRETWLSLLLRVAGLAFPGLSAHAPSNYVDSIRLAGKS
ncbi:triacylglycerol lipase OBL1 isoform X2 [Impatiens glandulifera]|uniref:triacylglycerol lipase OBL1 isoform X2 n=1 Tax=Impatiens glandulifera TaxID=253017 RepID=UPI001FB15254|nr:triacylglycerol lipase OBL1 isoform X2 [Impatiens glandulifera]